MSQLAAGVHGRFMRWARSLSPCKYVIDAGLCTAPDKQATNCAPKLLLRVMHLTMILCLENVNEDGFLKKTFF